ncbi:ChaN family lipoprotein [Vibrio sp. JC009]|uniref:ChaN family lipoprotein n=1 Tax=Vibrio sp. JC009 TaxID=2912314 RepID=UPI0023B0816F|nr:ChaN family lipoprotein [Vibrio sp. JC009]WED20950.1 ChaN family lipoprotein [Vibrio sp. JC009]
MRSLALILTTLIAGCAGGNKPNSAYAMESYYDYQLFSGKGQALTLEQLANELGSYDVILVGEWHTHPATHLFQARLLQSLHRKLDKLALSMEQFSRDKQDILDQYLNGDIGEVTLTSEAKAWPNYESDYRPLVEYSKANAIPVIAANAPKQVVRCIGQEGLGYLDILDEKERLYIAKTINTSDSPYKTRFMQSMHHGKPEDNANHFAAQVTWDETMAESIVRYLKANPSHKVMHIAGKFHTEKGLGIANSVQTRDAGLKVAVITPVSELSDNSPDYQLLVLAPPARFIQKENQMKSIHKMAGRNKNLKCEKPD